MLLLPQNLLEMLLFSFIEVLIALYASFRSWANWNAVILFPYYTWKDLELTQHADHKNNGNPHAVHSTLINWEPTEEVPHRIIWSFGQMCKPTVTAKSPQ